MRGTLIVTNDFPPRQGGIQSFVHGLAGLLPPTGWPCTPRPGTGPRRSTAASRSRSSGTPPRSCSRSRPWPAGPWPRCASTTATRCIFGAAAPLGLLAPTLRRAGATRQVALTHGHEAGWAALPGARQLLRRIGDTVDVVTYLGEYFRIRLARAMSPDRGTHGPARPRRGRGDVPGRSPGRAARRPPGRPLRIPDGAAQGPGHAAPRVAAGSLRRSARGRRAGAAAGRRWALPGRARQGWPPGWASAGSVVFTGPVFGRSWPAYYDDG